MGNDVARMEGMTAFNIIVGKPTGRRPLGKHWLRWEDSVRMDLKEIGVNAKIWIDSS